MRISMLDMGERRYGDCTYCEVAGKTFLIDGGHRGDEIGREGFASLPDQLQRLTGHEPPFAVDLLIVTHCHSDHIGCLPEMVSKGTIKVRNALVADPKLGFGIPHGLPYPAVTSTTAERIAAALREEPLPPSASDAEIEDLIDGAATLQQRYDRMLHDLERSGARVVRYGRDPHIELASDFSAAGFAIIGPTFDQLLICADRIRIETERRKARVRQSEAEDGAYGGEAALYRTLVALEKPDGINEELEDGGIGAALNNQSIVVRIGSLPTAALLTGDMQFARSGVGNLKKHMALLRQAVQNAGPYAFARLAHHGAKNGTDATLLDLIPETLKYGISTGSGDPWHPSPSTIELLASRRPEVEWGRTDRNGMVSVTWDTSGTSWDVDRGSLNDQTTFLKAPAAAKAFARKKAAKPVSNMPPYQGFAEDRIGRLYHAPRLTFVTDLERLKMRIGDAAEQAIALIAGAKHRLLDVRDGGLAARDIAAASRGSAGVVLLGGHHVLPTFEIDALPPALRRREYRGGSYDRDDFVVWSDDPYGDPDGIGVPTIPVSRIPDAHDGDLVLRALNPFVPSDRDHRFGLRNLNRPFAEQVFTEISGENPMLTSHPISPTDLNKSALQVDSIYLMLHGYDDDATHFSGEAGEKADEPGSHISAFTLANIPVACRATVFAGCCYGALWLHSEDESSTPREIERSQSIALGFLGAGARAYVGSTATHYSPPSGKATEGSGPFHSSFWRKVAAGMSPSRALMETKIEYTRGMPYDASPAVEYKTWRMFTCLGLGW